MRLITQIVTVTLVAGHTVGNLPPAHAQPSQDCAAANAPAPKKKGSGLRGLLGASNRAGVGNFLGSGILGGGRAGAAGEIAGKALEQAETAGGNAPGKCVRQPEQREWRAVD
jgi:hypothetical protein